MKDLLEIEDSVLQLSPTDFEKFSQWFWDYGYRKWDLKVEKDIEENKLSNIANTAINDFRAGKFNKL